MNSSNPAMKPSIYADAARSGIQRSADDVMSVEGAVNKTAILTLILIASASYVWSLAFKTSGYDGVPAVLSNPSMMTPWIACGGIGGFILALVTIFKTEWAPYTAPGYAVLEGLLLGGVSAMSEMQMPGIVIQAAMLTMGTLATMLMAYKAGVIKVTDKLRSGIIMATGGVFFAYLITMVLGFFGVNVGFMHNGSPLSIGISVVVIGVAAMNLLLDFDMIEQGANQGAPKFMEWYSGFALLVTLVWLYLEFLRLLSKLNSRD